jgi:hypothetical protein
MATQSRQKNYADPKRLSVQFQVDDKTLLKCRLPRLL